ncbi:hypothetical protein [Haloechinothrix sp. LS1_15]|uniref:hypothetical protein n=1 Tax=Haloechinothrix sp. LS1_15 TaxID=2652248 RepID=UPI00294B92A9|nr:hypothetical protein [Haloechinothrix sp. LS1_15]
MTAPAPETAARAPAPRAAPLPALRAVLRTTLRVALGEAPRPARDVELDDDRRVDELDDELREGELLVRDGALLPPLVTLRTPR